MGYFSNGTEGMIFTEMFCERCVNWRDLDDNRGPGCPIWDAHLMFAYEECNSESNAATILGMLIRRVDTLASDGLPVNDNECAMFLLGSEART